MTQTVVILDPTTRERATRYIDLLPPGLTLTYATARGDAHLKEVIAEADYAISGQVAVSGDVLRAARKLKLLHKFGVGVDNFDLETAKELGIVVARTTGSNAVPVAELTLALILSALRLIPYAHAELKRGEWRTGRLPTETYLLSKKTVGIVGFGAIGQNLARLLRGFDCRILYAQRTALPTHEEAALGAKRASLGELLAASDVVTLNCPLTPETAGMIDAAALRSMKPTAVLINAARGGVVVEADLLTALRARTILGAAMDVFETEPLPPDSPLLTLDNLVVTPHLGAIASDNFSPTVSRMFANIVRMMRGEPIPSADRVV